MVDSSSIVWVLAQLLVTTLIIYFVTKFMGETEGIGKALLAAIVGTVVYALTYWLLGSGLLAAFVGGIVWLLALRSMYKIGWLKAFIIALVIWVVATVIGLFLPTLPGPF